MTVAQMGVMDDREKTKVKREKINHGSYGAQIGVFVGMGVEVLPWGPS